MDRRVPLTPDIARLISQTLGVYRVHTNDALAAQGPGYTPGGAFRTDRDAVNAAPPEKRRVQDRILATGMEGADLAFTNAQDHISALESDLLRDPAPIWSTLTLCRAILESTVVGCHLLDPSVTTNVRLARMAALWLDDTSLAERSAGTFGVEHAEEVREYGQFKLSELSVGGFSVDRDAKNRPVRVQFGDASAPLSLNMTDAATKLLPAGMPSSYRLGSGAAHSRPWLLERSATKTPSGEYVGEAATAEAASLTAMFCMEAYVSAWGPYFGLQVNESLGAMEAARLMLGRGIVSDGARRGTP
jgi:hypothetical protein